MGRKKWDRPVRKETPPPETWKYTPRELAKEMLDWAEVRAEHDVLEPSAGLGAIAGLVKARGAKVFCLEIDGAMAKLLRRNGFNCLHADFMKARLDRKFDRIIMNPPFAHHQDLAHIQQAWTWLKVGGILVSACQDFWTYRAETQFRKFRQWFETIGGEQRTAKLTTNPQGNRIKPILVRVAKM